MKGMQKISRGACFAGVLKYAFADSHAKFLGTSKCLKAKDEVELAEEFKLIQSFRGDIKKPVWHQSLRLMENEIVDHKRQLLIAHDYMAQMKFDLRCHQYVVVAHGNNHVHIIANRISVLGEVWYGRQENFESTRIIQALERLHDLRITPGPEYKLVDDVYHFVHPIVPHQTKKPKRAEVQQHRRLHGVSPSNPPMLRAQIASILDRARKAGLAGGLVDFISVAEARGLGIYAKMIPVSKPAFTNEISPLQFKGFAFELKVGDRDALRISGSGIAAKFSGPRILSDLRIDEEDAHSLLCSRNIPFGPNRYVKPVWQLSRRLKTKKTNEYRLRSAGLAKGHSFTSGRPGALHEIPSLNDLRSLSRRSLVCRVERSEHPARVRVLPRDERAGLGARRAESTPGLRPLATVGRTDERQNQEEGAGRGQTESESPRSHSHSRSRPIATTSPPGAGFASRPKLNLDSRPVGPSPQSAAPVPRAGQPAISNPAKGSASRVERNELQPDRYQALADSAANLTSAPISRHVGRVGPVGDAPGHPAHASGRTESRDSRPVDGSTFAAPDHLGTVKRMTSEPPSRIQIADQNVSVKAAVPGPGSLPRAAADASGSALYIERLEKIEAAGGINASAKLDGAYLRAAHGWLNDKRCAGEVPDVLAWRFFDLNVGGPALEREFSPGRAEEALARLSPAALIVEKLPEGRAVAAPAVRVDPNYGRSVMDEMRAKKAQQKTATERPSPRASRPRP